MLSGRSAELPFAADVLDCRILFSVPGMRENTAGIRTRMIAAYRRESGFAVGALHAAIVADDLHALRTAAHRLKSASGALGAMRVLGLARVIEDAARGGSNAFDAASRTALDLALQQTFAEFARLDEESPAGVLTSAANPAQRP